MDTQAQEEKYSNHLFADGILSISRFLSQSEWHAAALTCHHWHHACATSRLVRSIVLNRQPFRRSYRTPDELLAGTSDILASLIHAPAVLSHSLRRHITEVKLNESVQLTPEMITRATRNLPSLTSLDVHIDLTHADSVVPSQPPQPPQPSFGLPRLTHLALRSTSTEIQSTSPLLHTDLLQKLPSGAPRLTHLTLESFPTSVSLAPLASCTMIHDLTIINRGPIQLAALKQLVDLTSMSSLRTLRLNDISDNSRITEYMKVLCLPSYQAGLLIYWTSVPLRLPQVTEVDLTGCMLERDAVKQLHCFMPNLTTLRPYSFMMDARFTLHELTELRHVRIEHMTYMVRQRRKPRINDPNPPIIVSPNPMAVTLLTALSQCAQLIHLHFVKDWFAQSQDWMKLLSSCPNLSSLKFEMAQEENGRLLEKLIENEELQRLCGIHIKHLVLENTFLASDTAMECLRHLTELEHLELHGYAFNKVSWEQLKQQLDDFSLLPNLNRLVIVSASRIEFEYDREKGINTEIFRISMREGNHFGGVS